MNEGLHSTSHFLEHTSGEVAEWLKAHAWKACVRKYREFESHLLRQILSSTLIAGPCATRNRKTRQVRKEATVATLLVCQVTRLSFFLLFVSHFFTSSTGAACLISFSPENPDPRHLSKL